MKHKFRTIASILLAVCMVLCVAACDDEETPVVPTPTPTPQTEYVTVTVVNGLFSGKTINNDRVEKGTSVTVVANDAPDAENDFTQWEVDGAKVSDSATYTFAANADTTVTAVYGSNYSVWDGEIPAEKPATLVEDEENRVVHIQDAAALAYFGDLMSADVTDKTAAKYSTFDWGIYSAALSAGQSKENALYGATQGKSAWTVSIDCNIDMAGYAWTPINNKVYSWNDITIDGNNRVVKNFYVRGDAGDNKGFFGELLGSNITIKDWVFDGAAILSEEDNQAGTPLNGNIRNAGIIIGYVHAGNRPSIFADRQITVVDNVSVINSKMISQWVSNKLGFIVGRLGAGTEGILNRGDHEKQDVTIKNSTVSNVKITARHRIGGLIGHIYTGDADQTAKDWSIVKAYNNVIENITAITSLSAVTSDVTYAIGTLGWWNYSLFNEPGNAANQTSTSTNIDADINNDAVTLIDLHCGYQKMVCNIAAFQNRLEATTASDEPESQPIATYGEIFVVEDLDMTLVAEDMTWTANENQYVYLVDGATVTGLDLGEYVRYISGERNEDGHLIVTDAEGNEIGTWVISEVETKLVGAFVAAPAPEPEPEV